MEFKYVFDNETKELATGGETFPILPGGIGKILFDKMKMHAEKGLVAQIQAETGIKESYADFLNRSIKLALYLKQEGIKPGDVISMCSHNNMHNSVVLVAVQFIGAILASTDPMISVEDTTYLLNLVEPKMVFVSEGCEDLIQNAINASYILQSKIVTLNEHVSYESLNVPYTEDDVKGFEPFYVEDSLTTACILFSSGTSGMAKGTCINHNFLQKRLGSDVDTPGVFFGQTTLYWGSGYLFTIFSLYSGGTKLNRKQFDAETLWETVEKYKVNLCYLSYSHCIDGLKYLQRPIPDLRLLLIIGGQIAINYLEEYEKKLTNTIVAPSYGMTECGFVAGRQADYKMGSSGRPLHNNQIIKIVDPETEIPLDLNEVGEIRVKGKNQMTGYYKMDSSNAWDADGFLKTGDLGYLDDSYNLFVVERIKEMFKYRSWHVVPAKIERALLGHNQVLHAVVFGVPNAGSDYLARGLVVLKENGTSVTGDELVQFVNKKMDYTHQIRAGIIIIKDEEMPYTATGKINRRKVKEMFGKQSKL